MAEKESTKETEEHGQGEPKSKVPRLTVAEVETKIKRLPWVSSYGQNNYVVNCFLARIGDGGAMIGGMITVRQVKLTDSGKAERECTERISLYLSEIRDLLPYIQVNVLEPFNTNGGHLTAQDLPPLPRDVRKNIRIFLFHPSGAKKGESAKLGIVKRGYNKDNPDVSVALNLSQLDKIMGGCYQLLEEALPLCMANEIPYEPGSNAGKNIRDATSYSELMKKKKKSPLKLVPKVKPEKGQKSLDEFKKSQKTKVVNRQRRRQRTGAKAFILDEAEEGEETEPSEASEEEEEIVISDEEGKNSSSEDDEEDKPGPSGLSRIKEVPDSDDDRENVGRVMKKKKSAK